MKGDPGYPDFGTSVPPEISAPGTQLQANETNTSKSQRKSSSMPGSAAQMTGIRASRTNAENEPERTILPAVVSAQSSDATRPLAPGNGTQVTGLTTQPPAIVVQNLLDSLELTKRRLGAGRNPDVTAQTSSNAQNVTSATRSARGPLDLSSRPDLNSRSTQASSQRTLELPFHRQSVQGSRQRHSTNAANPVYQDLRQVPDDVLRSWSSGHPDCVWENYVRGREQAREEARREEAWRATQQQHQPSRGCPCATCQMMQLTMPGGFRRSGAGDYQ
ncbi:hypothetical protein GGR57DRAFT_475198 [Xylariaceae sp. FL1272]|nr:hypothetical protein GGR57DRAFT_475198 [Xylariaceae sp. FL1272]